MHDEHGTETGGRLGRPLRHGRAGLDLTGRGYPYGPGSDAGDTSALRTLSPEAGAPLFAGVLLVAAVIMLTLSGRRTVAAPLRAALLTYIWLVVAVLLVVLPDIRLLTLAGYLPMLIIGFPFGWPPVDYAEIFTWTLANQAFAVLGGLLLARAALRWQFGSIGACPDCGRSDRPGRWTRESAARWGKPATYLAAVIPLLYAVVRLAWAAGIPLGISREFLDEMQETGLVWAGAGLGAFAVAGAILTLGLVQRWGEVFPRWMVGLAGRRVPIRLATVPATLVAIFVMSASVGFFTQSGASAGTAVHGLAAAPILTWPFWSLSLGAATLAYYLRRRPACTNCGRGHRPAGLVSRAEAGAY
ncbi:hypothetical protein M1L60_05540 [Actinoplanes sp. TRM 88003]|uniref:Uncharacterized protein n=1 Tax=Paractinoplanes aksuensis TaxID=2939490 RepID=A0ABT1DGT9_9ACTN|nr:hypothetical protein [Actinoplanes aksuensis]MCO8270054.1 hypothetical protein [Actinoplanes aksuensis]